MLPGRAFVNPNLVGQRVGLPAIGPGLVSQRYRRAEYLHDPERIPNRRRVCELSANSRGGPALNEHRRRFLDRYAAIFEKLYVDEQGEIVHEYAEPFDLLLSEPMVSSVIEKLDAAELTAEQSAAIDQAWANLSALWATEEAARQVRAAAWGDQIRYNERTPGNLAAVGGSNMTLMVGAEGLEPPTSSL